MKLFARISFLGLFLISCGSPQYFSLKIANKESLTVDTTVNVSIINLKNKDIDSIVYEFQGKKILASQQQSQLSLEHAKLGKYLIKAFVYFEGKTDTLSRNITVLSDKPPKIYTYKILHSYPHDIKAYTQGLEFYKDTLYESTGRYGHSSLRKVNYKTGEILKQINLSKAYFGEGITIKDDRLYMLTWQKRVGFIYNLNFEKEKIFSYNKSNEGWGLCHDDTYLYKSDGTEKIWRLNPDNLTEKDYIQICSDKSIFSKANELEWVDGKIYANTYLKDGIMIIDAESGAVIGVVDCRGLKENVTQHEKLDVLNGIAFNPKTNTFFITGKNWDKLFEVEILEK